MENIKIDVIWFGENTKECKYKLTIAIANHPNTPENVLQHLASSQTGYILQCTAKNPNTPVNVLK